VVGGDEEFLLLMVVSAFVSRTIRISCKLRKVGFCVWPCLLSYDVSAVLTLELGWDGM